MLAPCHKGYPDKLRHVAVMRANQVRALDITYIPMRQGFVRLAAVVGVASLRVPTQKVARALEACHAKETKVQALARHRMPRIAYTEQGSVHGLGVLRCGTRVGAQARDGRARSSPNDKTPDDAYWALLPELKMEA